MWCSQSKLRMLAMHDALGEYSRKCGGSLLLLRACAGMGKIPWIAPLHGACPCSIPDMISHKQCVSRSFSILSFFVCFVEIHLALQCCKSNGKLACRPAYDVPFLLYG